LLEAGLRVAYALCAVLMVTALLLLAATPRSTSLTGRAM
jgi:hypothetical protein